jgi:SAM-dependent methyltransferase
MTYEKFALLYDELMRDVPYDDWISFINKSALQYGIKEKRFLDLGCGTGEISIRLAKEGYAVTGVDLSAEMLAIAREKANESGTPLLLIEQDMSQLEDLGEFDMVGIFCDSLNYLQEEMDIVHTFERVYLHLKKGGLFLFDIHSLYKMNELFLNQTYAYNGEEISYIWQCFEGEYPDSVEHELAFFKLNYETKQYERYDELHIQRTFSIDQYVAWLNQTGFNIRSISADFLPKEPTEESERIFFVVQKPE